MIQRIVTAGALCLAMGCSGGHLDQDEVTSIPDGDAQGAAFSGEYELEIRTLSCDGSCSGQAGIFLVSFCDVGDVDTETVTFAQADGHLTVDWEEPISRLEGGIDQDGSYDVGGYGTESGNQVAISVRSTGTISGDVLAGEAQSLADGELNGDTVSCRGSYQVTGSRRTETTDDDDG